MGYDELTEAVVFFVLKVDGNTSVRNLDRQNRRRREVDSRGFHGATEDWAITTSPLVLAQGKRRPCVGHERTGGWRSVTIFLD